MDDDSYIQAYSFFASNFELVKRPIQLEILKLWYKEGTLVIPDKHGHFEMQDAHGEVLLRCSKREMERANHISYLYPAGVTDDAYVLNFLDVISRPVMFYYANSFAFRPIPPIPNGIFVGDGTGRGFRRYKWVSKFVLNRISSWSDEDIYRNIENVFRTSPNHIQFEFLRTMRQSKEERFRNIATLVKL